jgi:hypothetical protein
MSLRPRHYILLVVVLGLFAFNIVRYRHAKQAMQSVNPAPAPIVTTSPRVNTPAWTAFDQAADQRDAADAQFLPAMKNLQTALASASPGDTAIQDVKGCEVWLEEYRQNAKHPGPDTTWKTRSQHHLDGCVQYHLDTSTR